MTKKKTTSAGEARTIVNQLLSNPASDPMEFDLRVSGHNRDAIRAELARQIVEEELSEAESLAIIQYLLHLGPRNAAVPLLNLVADPAGLMERRVIAFTILAATVPRELARVTGSFSVQQLGQLLAAADRFLENELAKNRREERREITTAESSSGEPRVCRLKVTLRHVKPAIWRRIEVLDDTTFAKLHSILQAAMGWTDTHLHRFHAAGEDIGVPDAEWEVTDSRRVRLRDLIARGVKRFDYEYDFGDGWEHSIVIEKTIAPEEGVVYPRCVAGKRACPPEDCGGPYGYSELLEILADPDHPEYEDRLEWTGPLDPEACDLGEVNHQLSRMAKRRSKRKR